MKITRFHAENFRNIKECDLSFSDGVNLFFGENAQGKTNAMEGIYLFSRGKSFRKIPEKNLIRFGEEGFSLGIEYEDRTGKNSLSYTVFGGERKRTKNGYPIERVSEMIGSFRAVLFYPDHLLLVKEGPEERRNFLDVAISQCYPVYLRAYSDYKRTAEQRNCLLRLSSKGIPVDREELVAWSESLAEYAATLYLYRKQYIEALEGYTSSFMKEISDGREEVSLKYQCDIRETSEKEEAKERYREVFLSDLDHEMNAGTTLYGMMRDDLSVRLNGKSARLFASQGQQRSLVLALKMAEGEVSRDLSGEYPVFLLDDVLSELDGRRREFLLGGSGEKQILITSCSKKETEGVTDHIIEVRDGGFFPLTENGT